MIRTFCVTLRLLPELVECLRNLGTGLGWRYWRIMCRAAICPELALEWVRACRLQSIAQPDQAEMYHGWADYLEKSYALYMETLNIKPLEWTRYDAGHLEARPDPSLAYLLVEDEGRWSACTISGRAYKRVSAISPDGGETLDEAKTRCAGHWEILNK